tara:strand:- start:114 stop:425 length:312 start_codon:yes stop_codon:yes gene_type:complete
MRHIITTIVTALTLVILFALLYLVVLWDTSHWNGLTAAQDCTFWQKVGNRVYFSLATASTVGFGDISPKTILGRSMVSLEMLAVFVGTTAFVLNEVIVAINAK